MWNKAASKPKQNDFTDKIPPSVRTNVMAKVNEIKARGSNDKLAIFSVILPKGPDRKPIAIRTDTLEDVICFRQCRRRLSNALSTAMIELPK